MKTIQENTVAFIKFINEFAVPVIFALAFIFLLFGIFRYFIAGGANEEKRQDGVKFVTWGIVALAIMVSLWGLVNLLVNSLGFGGQARPCLPTFGKSDCSGSARPL
jgi:heme/copper-type cytochrome/quinol oxidase subunit 4